MHSALKLLCLALSVHAAAQAAPDCRKPSVPPHVKLDRKYLTREKFSSGEKVYFRCAEDVAPFAGSRWAECVGGKWTTLTCERTSCGNAGDLPNGQFEYKGTAATGDVVYAKCNDGYTLKGMKFMTCQRSGWTGEFPTCEVTTCSSPALANAVVLGGDSPTYRVGDAVNLTCKQGFKLMGPQRVTCGAGDQWQPRLPQCLRSSEVTCKKPKIPRYTVMKGLKVSYQPGDTVSFSCKEGFRLNGLAAATCGPDGNWSPPLPKCLWVKCPVLQVPHGALSSGYRRVGSVVTVRCLKGFHSKGPCTVHCLKNETWSEIPKCSSGKEAEPPCPSPAVLHAEQSGGDALVHSRGHTVTFTCKPGFQLTGSQQVTCGPGGQWQPQLPQCLPSSGDTQESPDKQGGCAKPVDGANVHLADRYITMKTFASGDQVVYTCDIGYVAVSGGSRYRKCNNGKWSPLLLECKRKSCGSAGEISHGEFMYTGAEFGDTASAVCNEGYELVGRGTRVCMSGGWDGHIPSCEVVYCAEPPEVMNADKTGVFSGLYKYNNVVNYRCREGTLVGQSEIWCTKNGTWSSPPPQCEDVTCPFPNVPNSSRRGALMPPFKHRSVVSFQCHHRYQMFGESSVTCGLDGRWTPDLPKCGLSGRY